jgi:hypothetical protein
VVAKATELLERKPSAPKPPTRPVDSFTLDDLWPTGQAPERV